MTSALAVIDIVVADGRQLLRAGLRALLERERDLRVVADTSDAARTVAACLHRRPGVLLLDVGLPGGGAAWVLEQLRDAEALPNTLLFASAIEKRELLALLRLGARGYVLADSPAAMFTKAVRASARGECWLSSQGLVHTLDALRELARETRERRALEHLLTHRELQIVLEIAEGAANKDVAKKLGLSEQTVKNHLSSVYDKLGVSTRLELALFAVEHHLTTTD